MLLKSDRHTAKDLACWSELERADAVHAASLAPKIEKALDAVRQFSKQSCNASVSWGKDSTVVAHLGYTVDSTMPIVWVRWLVDDNPDSQLVAKRFAEMFPDANLSELIAPDDDHDDGRRGFAMLEKLHARRVVGIRKSESSDRMMSRAVHGVSTTKVCRPIIDWTLGDVMAYLALHDLPVHPVYAMLGGGRYSRESLRVDSLGGQRGTGMGRREWEQCYYGDVLNRIKAKQCMQK